MKTETNRITQIDEAKLDREFADQPGLVYRATVREADAKHEHAQAKARLELAEAELSLGARSTPSEFNLPEKPTVDAIRSAVVAHPQYQEAIREMNQAKHAADVFAAEVSALQHKKNSLEGLLKLHETNYYSEPKAGAAPSGFRETVKVNTPEFRALKVRNDGTKKKAGK